MEWLVTEVWVWDNILVWHQAGKKFPSVIWMEKNSADTAELENHTTNTTQRVTALIHCLRLWRTIHIRISICLWLGRIVLPSWYWLVNFRRRAANQPEIQSLLLEFHHVSTHAHNLFTLSLLCKITTTATSVVAAEPGLAGFPMAFLLWKRTILGQAL